MKQLNPPHDEDYRDEEVDKMTLSEALIIQQELPLYIKRAEQAMVDAKKTLAQAELIYKKHYNEIFLKAEARTASDKKAMAELAMMNDKVPSTVSSVFNDGKDQGYSYEALVEFAQQEYSNAMVSYHYQQNRFDEIKMRVSSLKEEMKRI